MLCVIVVFPDHAHLLLSLYVGGISIKALVKIGKI